MLRDGVQSAKQRVVKLLRVAMLLLLSLEDEDAEALRQGLGPELQRKLFSAWPRREISDKSQDSRWQICCPAGCDASCWAQAVRCRGPKL